MLKGILKAFLACLAIFFLCPQCPGDNKDEDDIICVDVDGDGYGRFCEDGYDCRDDDPEHWSDCHTCRDDDEDGSYIECDTYITLYGPDCDDEDIDNWESCDTCEDSDNDGFFSGCDAYVVREQDCDDDDIDNWVSCAGCKDGDTDGWFVSCDQYTVRLGPDCDDSDPDYNSSCDYCVDNDSDGYWVGETCSGVLTGDCDDQDPNINPGEVEVCGDGIDQNCDGEDIAPHPDGVPCFVCSVDCTEDFEPVCVGKYGTGEYCYEINECFARINCENVECVLPLDPNPPFLPDPTSPCAANHKNPDNTGCADTPCTPL